MKNLIVGDKVVTSIYDYSNDRGMGPDRVKVYGYVTKVNKVTCDITLIDRRVIRKNIVEVGLYIDPFYGLKFEDLK